MISDGTFVSTAIDQDVLSFVSIYPYMLARSYFRCYRHVGLKKSDSGGKDAIPDMQEAKCRNAEAHKRRLVMHQVLLIFCKGCRGATKMVRDPGESLLRRES